MQRQGKHRRYAIDPANPIDVPWLAARLGVTEEVLLAASGRVGNDAYGVEAHLNTGRLGQPGHHDELRRQYRRGER